MILVLRAAFALLLGAGVMIQAHWLQRPYPPADSLAGLLEPLAGLHLTTALSEAAEVVAARAEGCDAPLAVTLIDLDGGENARAATLLGPDRRALYVYLGAVGERPAAGARYGRWLRANLAAMLGLRAVRAPSHMAFVALPKACPELALLDWALLSPTE